MGNYSHTDTQHLTSATGYNKLTPLAYIFSSPKGGEDAALWEIAL